MRHLTLLQCLLICICTYFFSNTALTGLARGSKACNWSIFENKKTLIGSFLLSYYVRVPIVALDWFNVLNTGCCCIRLLMYNILEPNKPCSTMLSSSTRKAM